MAKKPGPATQAVTVQERIAALFTQLRIGKVVFVDDMIIPTVDAAAVTQALTTKPDAAVTLARFFPRIVLGSENEALFEQISATMEPMTFEVRTEMREILLQYDDDLSDAKNFFRLRELLPDVVGLDLLAPGHWHKNRQQLIDECTEDRRTLFLFDQDLNADEQELGFRTGADIIKSIALSEPTGFGARWFCGMLSHTLQMGDEITVWRELADSNNIALKFFMPIAKASLRDGDQFFGAVYRTVINTYCENMKGLASKGFQTALATALSRFADLDPIDFEHMVVKSSEIEGVSELETLLRLYAIIHKDEVKSTILKESTFLEFSAAASAVKEVADTVRALPPASKERLYRLRRTELYDDGELVNAYNDPLRNGDLFEIGQDALGMYVLIAQPCDIMVRSDGQRARENNFKIAVLAPILTVPLSEHTTPKDGLTFILPNFGIEGNQAGHVEFAKATVANLHVLDLAVLSKTGHCEIHPDAVKMAEHRFPSRAWESRIKELAKHFKKVSSDVEEVRKDHKDVVAGLLCDALLPRVGLSAALKRHGKYVSGAFSYPIRRCGHVRDPLAASLLAAFSRYLSRDAYEHDFADA